MRNDQIFTPPPIVAKMLDKLEYFGDNLKSKTIFEPSFGEGAFLKQIAIRILEYAKTNHLTQNETIAMLNNVFGVEIDKKLFDKTKEELIGIVQRYGIQYNWDQLLCADTTTLHLNKNFDLCVGNPPFIRCHDCSKQDRDRFEKDFEFGQGNTDLYVIFFEVGIKALKADGKLCYITPNSFLKNTSQKKFREYLSHNQLVVSIDDYATVPVFGKIATYTAITLIDKSIKSETTKYTMMELIDKALWSNNINLLSFGSAPWSVSDKTDEMFLKNIHSRKTKLSDLCYIQYGLATNADKVYITSSKKASSLEGAILRQIIKGSTLDSEQLIIFPYQFNPEEQKFDLIAEERLKTEFPKAYFYLSNHKDVLAARDMEKGAMWYQYGRSQGIQNSHNEKIVVKHIIAPDDDVCSVKTVGVNTLVYSGIFIVLKDNAYYDLVMNALRSKEFCKYVKLVGKNMSGGYKSFNATAIKNFGIIET